MGKKPVKDSYGIGGAMKGKELMWIMGTSTVFKATSLAQNIGLKYDGKGERETNICWRIGLSFFFFMDKRFSSSEIPTEWGKQSYCLVGKLFV